MRDFFGWSSTKMTTEYISTSKAAVMDVAGKLASADKNFACVPAHDKKTEQDELGHDTEGLWEEGFPTEFETIQTESDSRKNMPTKMESEGKVFYFSNCTITNFSC